MTPPTDAAAAVADGAVHSWSWPGSLALRLVVLATLADNETRGKGRLMIAGGVAAVTYLVFGFGLSMSLPIWPWSP